MKSLKILIPVFLFCLLLSSCSENDDPLAKVKYQIVNFDNSITQIKYNIVGNTTVTVTDPNDFAGSGDSKTLNVNLLPFDSKLEVAANNTTNAVKHYVLVIYVDNQPKASYNLDVPAMSTSSGVVEYTVEAD